MERASRHPSLSPLDPLIGSWETRTEMGVASTRFAWHETGAFLVQHADIDDMESLPAQVRENLPFPLTTITGLDDASGALHMLYSDGRGVLRVYWMSLEGGIWRMWRDAPGFHQRFAGKFSEDGRRISAAWEFSRDGSSWTLDFNVEYVKFD